MNVATHEVFPFDNFPIRLWIIDIVALIELALLIEGETSMNFRGFRNLTVIWLMWKL